MVRWNEHHFCLGFRIMVVPSSFLTAMAASLWHCVIVTNTGVQLLGCNYTDKPPFENGSTIVHDESVYNRIRAVIAGARSEESAKVVCLELEWVQMDVFFIFFIESVGH